MLCTALSTERLLWVETEPRVCVSKLSCTATADKLLVFKLVGSASATELS